MRPASTSCAPSQSTTTTLANARKMRDRRDDAARQRREPRGIIRILDRGGETRVGRRLRAKRLHHTDGAKIFRCIGAGIGERILRGARAFLDGAPGGIERQDDIGIATST